MENNLKDNEIKELIVVIVDTTIQSLKNSFTNEWFSLKEGAAYANVSYNTFMKFRLKGLKISEVDGTKRVSRKEIDTFLENHSY